MTKKLPKFDRNAKNEVFPPFQDPLGYRPKTRKKLKKYFSCSLRCFLTERFTKYCVSMNLVLAAHHLGKKT